jgi:hypothetical protein
MCGRIGERHVTNTSAATAAILKGSGTPVGGLALSRVLTLYTMPVVYLYFSPFAGPKSKPALDRDKVHATAAE